MNVARNVYALCLDLTITEATSVVLFGKQEYANVLQNLMVRRILFMSKFILRFVLR